MTDQKLNVQGANEGAKNDFNEEYLHALQIGDKAAENQLITSLGPRIRTVLRSHLRSWDRTLDAYQETFLRVFTYLRSGKTLDSPSSLPGFVLAVSRNVAFEHLRSYDRQDQFPEEIVDPANTAPVPRIS
jgi:DNA-directed RNA polymerase specialized sigma24 family protein